VDEAVSLARLLTRAFLDDPIERWCLACDDFPAPLDLQYLHVVRNIAPKGGCG